MGLNGEYDPWFLCEAVRFAVGAAQARQTVYVWDRHRYRWEGRVVAAAQAIARCAPDKDIRIEVGVRGRFDRFF